MIAACWSDQQTPTTYYISSYACSSWYFKPDPRPDTRELRKRWWKYIEQFLRTIEPVTNLFRIARKVERLRIHHERQYPRIIKYRNNRNP